MASSTASAGAGAESTASAGAGAESTAFLADVRQYVGMQTAEPTPAPDEVNQAMIRHWVEAMGDDNPAYTNAAIAAQTVHGEIIAPPTMLQAWVMHGVRPRDPGASRQGELMKKFDDAGFVGVVATNCEQEYVRMLRLGDRLTMTSTLEDISEEKHTGLGIGHFVTTRTTYTDADGEPVGYHFFRILKFRPGTGKSAAPAPAADVPAPRPPRPRPSVTEDSQPWWDALRDRKLLIQRCGACGHLQHPPGPMCAACQSRDRTWAEAGGGGTVYSYVVTHHPQVPAFDYPLLIGLIELAEGTRLVADVVGIEPDACEVGLPVQVEFHEVDPDLTLPFFRVIQE